MDVKFNIWYAEDDVMFSRLVKDRLEKEEFKVRIFPSGDDLYAELPSSSVHLIMLDYDLPGSSGLEIVKKIREEDKTISIVVFSVHTESQIATEAYNQGVDFINKDCEWDLFLAKIRCFIRRSIGDALQRSVVKLSDSTTFDMDSNVIVIDNKDYLLTKVNSNLLKLLYSNINEWVSGDYLTRGLWQLPIKNKIKDLRRQIFFLREKLDNDPSIRIDNSYGSRYRLVIPILPMPVDEAEE